MVFLIFLGTEISTILLFMLLPSSAENVVGTAAPKEPPEHWEAAWYFSTGEELLVNSGASMSIHDLRFCLRNQSSQDSTVIAALSKHLAIWLIMKSNNRTTFAFR